MLCLSVCLCVWGGCHSNRIWINLPAYRFSPKILRNSQSKYKGNSCVWWLVVVVEVVMEIQTLNKAHNPGRGWTLVAQSVVAVWVWQSLLHRTVSAMVMVVLCGWFLLFVASRRCVVSVSCCIDQTETQRPQQRTLRQHHQYHIVIDISLSVFVFRFYWDKSIV